MDEYRVGRTPSVEEVYSLRQLHYWLRYEGLTGLLGGTVVWLPFGLVMSGLILLAALFTPYMLWHLWKARWYTSMVVFGALIVGPLAIAVFLENRISIGYYLLTMVPLVFFYAYTWTLRYMIGEHLFEVDSVRAFERERQQRTA